MQECSDEAFYKGVEMTMAQLKDILQKCGVTEIPAVGEPFNPDLHNAVIHVEDPAYGASTVAEEFEKGFMLCDKVIRCSMVKVAN
jgi:molecular chaperone GrpE